MFMHGGYWVIGHKDLMGFMAPAITPAPTVLVSVGYRLAPGAKYPQQVDDCRASLRWVYENIADYGGSPDRIHVSGHSAGGHLAAMLTLQREQRNALGLPDDVIKACFPVSGVFDVADTLQDRREAFLRTQDDVRDASPLHNTAGKRGAVPVGDRFRRFRQPSLPAPSDAGRPAFPAWIRGRDGSRGAQPLRDQPGPRRPRKPVGPARLPMDDRMTR